MKTRILSILNILFCLQLGAGQNILVKDTYSNEPVSFATISFGNGLGTFADGNGVFRFSQKLYPEIDTLFISSIGYQDLKIPVLKLNESVELVPQASRLATVVVNAELRGNFKIEKVKEIVHKEYEDCWLPTVESEIAVRFDRVDDQPTMISNLKLPILLEKSQRSKKDKLRKFSTMFRVLFYDVDPNGSPSSSSLYPTKTFIIDQKSDKVFELDITDLRIVIPKSGIFASIQVLGYTKPNGDLINAKKYREIKTSRGITKVSTTYRPLLPFTDQIKGKTTWVRRVFLNNKSWQLFDLEYNPMSKLVRNGHDNYGLGAELRVYPPQD
ncbi:MAG: carboxypeptidase-like regulatory domain-containing protein [Nonlabens sp.]